MKKYKVFINYDKEEEWLREMAQSGYQLMNVGFSYEFKESEPSDEIYRIDYRTFKNNEAFANYQSLFEDSGWRHISGSKSSGEQYFQRIDDDVNDDIFSDTSSKAGRYKRLSDGMLAIALIFFLLMVSLKHSINLDVILNPRAMYLTPGLWDKTGLDFWSSFIFETPFALLRSFGWLIIPIFIILYFYYYVKARLLYKRTKEMM